MTHAALPTLALHGLGRCGFDLEGVARELGGATAVPDAPGHGGRPLDLPLAFEAFARDALGVADQRGFERFRVVGVSMGAATAVTIASLVPDRVAGLLLVSPAWLQRGPRPHLRRLQKLGRLILDRGLDAAWRAVSISAPVSGWHRDDVEAYRDRFLAYDRAGVGTAMIELPAVDPVVDAAAIRSAAIALHVMCWADDPIHPPALAAELAGELGSGWTRLARPADRREEARVLATVLRRLDQVGAPPGSPFPADSATRGAARVVER